MQFASVSPKDNKNYRWRTSSRILYLVIYTSAFKFYVLNYRLDGNYFRIIKPLNINTMQSKCLIKRTFDTGIFVPKLHQFDGINYVIFNSLILQLHSLC